MPESRFVTYAQNAEDVMLWRALKHVNRGFYIDVGAQDPVIDSVSKAFYERGWRGINIEPVEHWHQRLVADRPHDINLNVATSNQSCEITMFEVEGSGLSTSDKSIAERYKQDGAIVREALVSCRTLDDICDEYDIDVVHFLKIDCEGAEKQTLEGLSLRSVRPWIILVEATEPNGLQPSHQRWEHLVVQRGYKFVYFDGLNRFYVAEEQGKLSDAFSTPPNPTEWSERAPVILAHRQIDRLTEQVARMGSAARHARTESERDHWRQQAQYWLGENGRREVAMGELRGMVDKMLQQSADFSNEIDRLRAEAAAFLEERARMRIEKWELEVQVTQRVHDAQALGREITRLRSELAELLEQRSQNARRSGALEREIERLRRDAAELREQRSQNARHSGALEQEIGRLQREWVDQANTIASLRADSHRDAAALASMRASRSWAVTRPLRFARRLAAHMALRAKRPVNALVRAPLRVVRPAMIRASRSETVRGVIVGMLGRDSAIIRRTRLFLFGSPPSPLPSSPLPCPSLEVDPNAERNGLALSQRERMALAELQRAVALSPVNKRDA